MKRFIILALLLVTALASTSFATRTRLLTLGEQFEVVMDESNIFSYPSRLYNYPKLAVGEIGYAYSGLLASNNSTSEAGGFPYYTDGMEFQQLGIHWDFCCKNENRSVFAIYLHNAEVDPGYASFPYWGTFSLGYNWFNDFDLLPNKRITLAYSRMMGNNPWGATFSWVHSSQSYKYEDTTTAYSGGGYSYAEGYNQYALRLGTTINNGNTDVSVGVSLQSWKDETYAFNTSTNAYETYDESKPSGNITFDASFRHFMARDCDYTFVPHAMVRYEKYGGSYYTWNGTAAEESDKVTANILRANVGLGWDWTPSQGVLAVFDGGINYNHGTFKEEDVQDPNSYPYKYGGTEFTLFYLHSGFEGQMFDWFTVRAGATTNWDWNTGTEEEDGNPEDWKYTYKEKYSSNDTYLGFGILWGDWHIDTYIDPAWLLNGPYFLTGNENTMNWQISFLRPF